MAGIKVWKNLVLRIRCGSSFPPPNNLKSGVAAVGLVTSSRSVSSTLQNSYSISSPKRGFNSCCLNVRINLLGECKTFPAFRNSCSSRGFSSSKGGLLPSTRPSTVSTIMEDVSSTTEIEMKSTQEQEVSESTGGGDETPVSSSDIVTGGSSEATDAEASTSGGGAVTTAAEESVVSESGVSQSGKIDEVQEEDKPKVFLRKRKTVLMMSYCGQGYLGMQRNPGMKTIEDDVLRSLLTMGYIDEEAYNKPQLMQFQRAARTDKHVSAARQIVSLKLPDNVDLEEVNKLLPPEIRVMGLKKVTKGFDCKGNCDARTYMYMIPSFAFTPIDQNLDETYRITPEVLGNLREALKLYLGTKNFHNFTSRRKPTDPSSKRYIMSFTASDPFMKDGLEYIILRVKGQSFMLHQIRKMIGLIAAYLRGFAGKDTFTKSWSLDRIDIPKAPGVGLVLDHVHYERYNKRYGSDGMHQTLTWDEVNEKVEKFCQEFIYPVITKCENEEKSMFNWLATLPYHTYDVREQKANTPLNASVLSAIGKAGYKVDKDSALRAVGIEEKGQNGSSDEESDDEDVVKPKRQKMAESTT